MELYKLFKQLHNRTDWDEIYLRERIIMMPEWYEERKRRQSEAKAKLASMVDIINRFCPDSYYSRVRY